MSALIGQRVQPGVVKNQDLTVTRDASVDPDVPDSRGEAAIQRLKTVLVIGEAPQPMGNESIADVGWHLIMIAAIPGVGIDLDGAGGLGSTASSPPENPRGAGCTDFGRGQGAELTQ